MLSNIPDTAEPSKSSVEHDSGGSLSLLLTEGLKGIFQVVQTRAAMTLAPFHLLLFAVTRAICWGSQHGAALEIKQKHIAGVTGLLIAQGTCGGLLQLSSHPI